MFLFDSFLKIFRNIFQQFIVLRMGQEKMKEFFVESFWSRLQSGREDSYGEAVAFISHARVFVTTVGEHSHDGLVMKKWPQFCFLFITLPS